MVDFYEALDIVLKQAVTTGTERVPLSGASGRILAGDALSDIDMPPFNKAAMDGFACRRSDLDGRLEVIESLMAGDIPQKSVGQGQCTRIMTGAKVPEGADCVIMIEHTEQEGERFIRFTAKDTAGNIAYRGEDLKSGDVCLHRGTLIKPRHIAILASAGCYLPLVARQPRVAVITTGDEIVEPDARPEGTFIRNSNGPQLVAQIEAAGAIPDYKGIVKDEPGSTQDAITTALSGNDMVILTGGVSMGDYDFVPAALRSAGVELFFEKVAVKPGRPTVFGRKGDRIVFGLPGNPVSAFVIFELIVKPLLYMMMGHEYEPVRIRIPIGVDYSRKKADRISWVPVMLNGQGEAIPATYHGSGHIHSLAGSWGLMGMERGVFNFKKGENIDVRQI